MRGAHTFAADQSHGRAAQGRALALMRASQVRIGASILQTPGAVVDEIRSIGAQVRAFDHEITTYLTAHGYVSPNLETMRTQLATLKKIDAGEYENADTPGIWEATQLMALRSGGFSDAHAQALLGNQAARRNEIASLQGMLTGALASALATAPPALRDLVLFYQGAWSAFVDEWKWWERAHDSWGDNFWTNHAPEAEKLLAQLGELREVAKSLGMRVYSPAPYNPDTGLWEGSGAGGVTRKAEGALGEIWTVIKWALFAFLGVGALILLSFAFRGKSVRGFLR